MMENDPGLAQKRYELSSSGEGQWQVREYEEGTLVREIPSAVTVREACRRLKKSRRQIYRYLKDGWIQPVGKFLNEWLVEPNSLEQCAQLASLARARLPRRLQYLFPEYRPGSLQMVRDAVIIVTQMLEWGTTEEVAWVLKTYPASWCRKVVEREGVRLLSPRSLNFWCDWFEADRPSQGWRAGGRVLGGVG